MYFFPLNLPRFLFFCAFFCLFTPNVANGKIVNCAVIVEAHTHCASISANPALLQELTLVIWFVHPWWYSRLALPMSKSNISVKSLKWCHHTFTVYTAVRHHLPTATIFIIGRIRNNNKKIVSNFRNLEERKLFSLVVNGHSLNNQSLLHSFLTYENSRRSSAIRHIFSTLYDFVIEGLRPWKLQSSIWYLELRGEINRY